MNTEVKNAIKATDRDAQYDESAKRLLGQKIILAHILVKTVKEFKGMDPKTVVPFIEGKPFISTIPLEPGLTNKKSEKGGQKIVGFNTENAEINEGLVRFDIVFYVRTKDGLSQIILNVDYSDLRIIPIISCLFRLCLYFNTKNRNNSCV
ncbi:hypothetical protein AMURIS_04190 [Acetatifactor muris]|uniref:Uncharacterized protein n=1 Tax=Acetatifactor muris TaxID=879566 RepID=A0A2K4ZLS9_9FIRM|nr:hypothetical protein [Acetatifactor muris]SOY31447.1 hypothetical protein AMURIS_04190 [Acetatifactor muris]